MDFPLHVVWGLNSLYQIEIESVYGYPLLGMCTYIHTCIMTYLARVMDTPSRGLYMWWMPVDCGVYVMLIVHRGWCGAYCYRLVWWYVLSRPICLVPGAQGNISGPLWQPPNNTSSEHMLRQTYTHKWQLLYTSRDIALSVESSSGSFVKYIWKGSHHYPVWCHPLDLDLYL